MSKTINGDQTDHYERGYVEGRRAFARHLAQVVRGELGVLGRSLSDLELELDEARSVLRRLCAEHGDNDWDDDLHLADVINKHLGRYLDD